MNKKGKHAVRAVSPDITMGPVVSSKKVNKEKLKQQAPTQQIQLSSSTTSLPPIVDTISGQAQDIVNVTSAIEGSLKIQDEGGGDNLKNIIDNEPQLMEVVKENEVEQEQEMVDYSVKTTTNNIDGNVLPTETIANQALVSNFSIQELQNILETVNKSNSTEKLQIEQFEENGCKINDEKIGSNNKSEEKTSTNNEESSAADGKVRRSTRIKSLEITRPPRSIVGGSSSNNNNNNNSSGNNLTHQQPPPQPPTTSFSTIVLGPNMVKKSGYIIFDTTDEELADKLKKFEGIEESRFKTERKISKESKHMICDCYLSQEEIQRGDIGCNEDCLNRLLMVECGSRCPTGDGCTNKKFQRKQYCPLEVFRTEKKGHGLRTLAPLPAGGFVIEYVGEVLDPKGFHARTKAYAAEKQEHFYFMALKSDAIIDATRKGNCSRFINHSCDPNCETQKWTVNGELRIGFFALRDLEAGEEITFDYQFQRYGKKAQQCFCMAEKCRGWIGGEEDEENKEPSEILSDQEEEEDQKMTTTTTTLTSKVKGRPGRPKKKRDENVLPLGDMALEEELAMLERTGLKNRNHTLMLCRLMIRAEDWDVRERILNILINGDSPCRRLFLDYHGLRLMYGWMSSLPLPTPDAQIFGLMTNDSYHILFLKALSSLPIPNRTILQDSKILPLMNIWSQCEPLKLKMIKSETPASTPPLPATTESSFNEDVSTLVSSPVTTPTTTISTTEASIDQIPIKMEEDESINKDQCTTIGMTPPENIIKSVSSVQENIIVEQESLPLPPIPGLEDEKTEIKIENVEFATCKVEDEIIVQTVHNENIDVEMIPVENKEVKEKEVEKEEFWEFVDGAKRILEGWSELKEVFRIPKKERVEQMKEHEREADLGVNSSITVSSSRSKDISSASSSSSIYDKDRKLSTYDRSRLKGDRRVPTLDSSLHNPSYRRNNYTSSYNQSHLTKEQRREMFAARVAQAEKEQKQRQMQDEMVALHQNRCASLGLDPATTPIVDPSGAYYLDPTTITWKEIDPQDPELPQELLLLVHASQYPLAPVEPVLPAPEPAEVAFPPWPDGLPPPPPLPPTVLPLGWKMAVDDLGRCYYYDVETRHTQWEPPLHDTINQAFYTDTSDSEDSENESVTTATTSADDSAQNNLAIAIEKKSRLNARREKRRNSGLVQERIISPRRDDEKPAVSQKQIRARKLQMAEEKMQNLKIKAEKEAAKAHPSSSSNNNNNNNSSSSNNNSNVNSEETENIEQILGQEEVQNSQEKTDDKMNIDSPGRLPEKESNSSGVDTEEDSSSKSEDQSNYSTENDDEDDNDNDEDVEDEYDEGESVAESHGDSGLSSSPNSSSSSSSLSLPSTSLSSSAETSSSSSSSLVKKSSRSSSKSTDKLHKSHKKSKNADKRSVDKGETAVQMAARRQKEMKASEEYFRKQIALVIVQYLNPYRKSDCQNGRITSTEDFKHLARKLTHMVTTKEVKHCKNAKTLVVNDSVKHKTKEFVKKYMGKFSGNYVHQPE